jgi:hypothetical protein
MAALRFQQFYIAPMAGPITFVLKPHFGQEMLPESRLGQGNFLQGAVKDDLVEQDAGRRLHAQRLPAIKR